ncbi:hypothetical protein D3P08_09635 [Paenibacillus nanensis]|uniref:Uncharacterized protein n=1 Tax=Paenibacillus nanensis TaxID=393251 RepID=A0A3A1UZH3_9BACL|nr:hypothetical protein [Paenibacillus nanensis]RIX53674.1 hypothetical protein D3P08_09635 [Paenibacillus nanensis]
MRTIVVCLFFLLAIGCEAGSSGNKKPVQLGTTTLENEYPGDISNVDKMELVDGSSGEKIRIEDKGIIQEWLRQMKDIELAPDDNQEGRVGYLFRTILYEGDMKKLEFLPDEMKQVYYEHNEQFEGLIRRFFEEQFGRTFPGGA